MNGFYAAVSCLPKLYLDSRLSEHQKSEIKEAIALAVNHPDSTIQSGIGIGIRDYLWEKDPEFSEKCFAGCIQGAKLHCDLLPLFRNVNGIGTKENLSKIDSAFDEIRKQIVSEKIEYKIEGFSFKTYSSWDLKTALTMIPNQNISETCKHSLQIFFGELVELERIRDNSKLDKVDHKFERLLFDKIGILTLNNGVDFFDSTFGKLIKNPLDSPELIEALVKSFTLTDAHHYESGHGWSIWNHFSLLVSEPLKSEVSAGWDSINWSKIGKIARSLLFGGVDWKNKEYETKLIASGSDSILAFFAKAGANPNVFEPFLILCYKFPSVFIPKGLASICKIVSEDSGGLLFKPVNSMYCLEEILTRFIVSDYRAIKGNASLKSSLLELLDRMVEEGSAKAYFLRERVVTLG